MYRNFNGIQSIDEEYNVFMNLEISWVFGSAGSLIHAEEVRSEKRRRGGICCFNKEINNHGTAHSSTSKPVIITQPWPLPVIALLFTAFGASAWGLRHMLGCITYISSHRARTEAHLDLSHICPGRVSCLSEIRHAAARKVQSTGFKKGTER